jgi:hypothetical protein
MDARDSKLELKLCSGSQKTFQEPCSVMKAELTTEEMKKIFNSISKRVRPCPVSEVFWKLIDCLIAEQSGFVHNRATLLDAYARSELYVIEFDDVQFGDYRNYFHDAEIDTNTLPAFCMIDNGKIQMIWTSIRFRRCGLATTFVTHFKVTMVDQMVAGSEPFWEKVLQIERKRFRQTE